MSDVEGNLTVEVVIPENVESGDTITVQCPDNSYVEFVAPSDVTSGDTVHVVIDGSKTNEDSKVDGSVPDHLSKTSYNGVAAVTTGVIVSALVIGPVITGIFVVGMVVCAAQKNKALSAPNSHTVEESVEEGGAVKSSIAEQESVMPHSESATREDKIAAAFVQTADYIVGTLGAIDDRLAISSNTLKALATVQEMDERNKISETVVTKIKNFDEAYKVSEKAGNAVTATVTKVHEIDASCKISENAFIAGNNIAIAGNNAVTCVGDFERRYEISTRITTALLFAMATLSDTLSVYMRRLTNSTAVDEVAPTAVVNNDVDLEGGCNGEEEFSLPEAPTHAVQPSASYTITSEANQSQDSYTEEEPVSPNTSIDMRSVEVPV